MKASDHIKDIQRQLYSREEGQLRPTRSELVLTHCQLIILSVIDLIALRKSTRVRSIISSWNQMMDNYNAFTSLAAMNYRVEDVIVKLWGNKGKHILKDINAVKKAIRQDKALKGSKCETNDSKHYVLLRPLLKMVDEKHPEWQVPKSKKTKSNK